MVNSIDLNRIKSFSVYKQIFSKLSNLRGGKSILEECEYILDNYIFDLSKDEIAVVYKIMASVHYSNNDYRACIYYAERAINTIPIYYFSDILTELYIVIGKAYQSLNDHSNALFYYNKVVMNSNYFMTNDFICEVLYNIGFLYYQLGDFNNAIKNFEACSNKKADSGLFSTGKIFLNIYLLFSYIEVGSFAKADDKYKRIKDDFSTEQSYFKDAIISSIDYRMCEARDEYKDAEKHFKVFSKHIKFIDDNIYKLEILFYRLKKVFELGGFRSIVSIESLLIECEQLAISLNDDIKLSYIYKKMMTLYEKNKQYDEIYSVFKKYFYVAERLDNITSVTGISVMNSIYHDINVTEEKTRGMNDENYHQKLSEIKYMSEQLHEKEEVYYFDIIYRALHEISIYQEPGRVLLKLKKIFDSILFLDQVSALTYDINKNEFRRFCVIGNELIIDKNEGYDFLKLLLMKSTADSNYLTFMCNSSREIEELIGQKIYTYEDHKLINSIVCVSAGITNESDSIICFSSTDINAYKSEHVLILKFLNSHFINKHLTSLSKTRMMTLEKYNERLLENLDVINRNYEKKIGEKYNEVSGIHNSGYFENKVLKMFSSSEMKKGVFSLTYIRVIAEKNGVKIYPKEEYKKITDSITEIIEDENIVVGRLLDHLFAIAIKDMIEDDMFAIIQKLASKLFRLANDELRINIDYLSSENITLSNYFSFRNSLVTHIENTSTDLAFTFTRDTFEGE